MASIDLDGKVFTALSNTENGEVSADTLFHYRQQGDMVWATYEGGSIRKGFLIGTISGAELHFSYQHLNHAWELMTGRCCSVASLQDGRLRLDEEWTCGDHSRGRSALIEVGA